MERKHSEYLSEPNLSSWQLSLGNITHGRASAATSRVSQHSWEVALISSRRAFLTCGMKKDPCEMMTPQQRLLLLEEQAGVGVGERRSRITFCYIWQLKRPWWIITLKTNKQGERKKCREREGKKTLDPSPYTIAPLKWKQNKNNL